MDIDGYGIHPIYYKQHKENTDIREMDINGIFKQAQHDMMDQTDDMDIEELLHDDKQKDDYKTLGEILDENICAVKTLGFPADQTKQICDKLVGYRYVENLFELHRGKHIRWIRNDKKTLTNGAIVMDVKFTDNGSHVLCRNAQHRIFQVRFNECLIFQKLSMGEQLILMAHEHVRTMDVSE